MALAFAAFWFGGAALMSRIAGWHALAALYPAPPGPRADEEDLRFCTATLGSTACPLTYRRCVRVRLSDDGLGLALMRPFRFHSPPFLAPWSAVTACTEKQLFATRKVSLAFAGTGRQVSFTGALGQAVKARHAAATRRVGDGAAPPPAARTG